MYLSIYLHCDCLNQCFSKWAGSPPILMDKGAKKPKGVIGGENAQPLIDDWVNFSILLLWLVSSLQISIYYDNCWRLFLKQFICWTFTLDRLCAQQRVDYFRAAEPSQKYHNSGSGTLLFMNVAPVPDLMVLMSVAPAPELSFFMTQAPAPDSIRFHTFNILIVLVCLKLNEKLMKSSTQNQQNITHILII